jgi:hypothetical protein
MPPHYRIADLEISRAGEQHVTAYSKVSTAAELLSNEDAALLRSCNTWLPLEEHAKGWRRQRELAPLRALSAAGPRWAAWALKPLLRHAERRKVTLPIDSAQLEKTQRRLEELVRRGFLVTAESLFDETRRGATPATLPPIASIGITTRNRSGVLRRGLVSHFENRRRYERSTDYVILDDGADAESEQRTRALLLSLRREFAVPIRYAGRSDRRSFAAALVQESGAPADLVDFALFGLPGCTLTTGGARNGLLLATAGDRLVMVDDDSVCRIGECPAREQGMALSSQRDPTEFWFFDDPQNALTETAFVDADFLALHETLLGRAIGECLPETLDFGSFDMHAAEPAFDRRLRLWGGQVRATMAGVLGDSGIGATGYLFVDAASQQRLTRSEAHYLAAVRSRQILRCARRTTISEGTSCIAVNLGLDNRSLLPPFIPVQRNSDGLFARVLRRCFRDGYLGYLPWAVLHDPEHPRQQDLEDYWRQIQQTRTPDLISHLLQAADAPQDGSSIQDSLGNAASLRRLGAQLEDWGSLSAIELDEVLQKQVWRSVAGLLSGQSSAEAPPATQPFYARYRRKYADLLRQRVTQQDYLLPADLQAVGGEQEVRALLRQIVRRFGQLLQGWPEIYAAALRLRARGIELAPLLRDE